MIKKRAIIRNGQIIYDEDTSITQANITEAKRNREDMKVDHRKDLLQPIERDFYKAYPEKVRDMYGDDVARLLS